MSWVKALDDEFIACRGLGHHWPTPRKVHTAPGVLSATLVCGRCGLRRNVMYAKRSGDVLYQRYDYPTGYEKPKGEKREPPRTFRRLVLDGSESTSEAPESEHLAKAMERLKGKAK